MIDQFQREKLLKTIPKWFHVLVKDLSATLRRQNGQFAELKKERDNLEKRVKLLTARLDEAGKPADDGAA